MTTPSTPPRKYKLGTQFPSEGFVQDVVERHFQALGFTIDATGQIDLRCVHPVTGERWQVEAKGKTAQPGLDFRTCLGQLVQQIRERTVNHGIAVPDIAPYERQINLVAPWVAASLRIHWILVSEDGSVRIIQPEVAA